MRKKTCPSLAILLGGLTLFPAAHAARADFLPSYTCCPTAVTVCRKSSPAVKFVSASRPVSPSCAVHYYATCWRDCAAPDYSHCQTPCCSPPIPLVPTPYYLPTPSKDKGDELPKPRVDEKPQSKPEAKPKPESKPQAMNIIYHGPDDSAFPSQLWRPIPIAGH